MQQVTHLEWDQREELTAGVNGPARVVRVSTAKRVLRVQIDVGVSKKIRGLVPGVSLWTVVAGYPVAHTVSAPRARKHGKCRNTLCEKKHWDVFLRGFLKREVHKDVFFTRSVVREPTYHVS